MRRLGRPARGPSDGSAARAAAGGRFARSRPYDQRMILVLDVGNTNLTLGAVAEDDVASTQRAPTVPGAAPDQLEGTLEELLAADRHSLASVERLVVVS